MTSMTNLAKPPVVVVGAGISGLCTALALAKTGLAVTVVERDSPPPSGDPDQAFFEWNRRGAAQFKHPHAFLAVMSNLLQDSFPGLMDDFFAAGARKVTFEDMLPPDLKEKYTPLPGDEKMWLLMCRRATMETVFRRYAEQQDLISIESDTQVTALLSHKDGDQILVDGISVKTRDEPERQLLSQVLIDAGGRNSKLKTWIQAAGGAIKTEDDDAEIVYFTRHYKLLPGVEEPARGNSKDRSSGDLGYIKYGVFPGEGGHFAVIACLHKEEKALHEAIKSSDQFDLICRSIPGLVPWVAADKAEPTTESFGFGDIHAVWHHFVDDGRAVALNYFAVGDAALRTNPLYGRGCSTGIIHAHLLADTLRDISDPVARALQFHQRTEEELRPIFKASLAEDKKAIRQAKAEINGQVIDSASTAKAWFNAAFGDALSMASTRNIHVLRGIMRTFNLLEKPGDFLKDKRILLTTMAYMLGGRKRNANARKVNGPGRQQMLTILTNKQAQRESASA
jgi:2-polyprenyl-6-methoxyphenol hydroxylase-like FAD-dependent oxidoreductase